MDITPNKDCLQEESRAFFCLPGQCQERTKSSGRVRVEDASKVRLPQTCVPPAPVTLARSMFDTQTPVQCK